MLKQELTLNPDKTSGQRWTRFVIAGTGLRCAPAMICATFVLFFAGLCSAQLTTGSLSGTVEDSTGAVIPNAKVDLLNEGSGAKRDSISDAAGRFTFAAVDPGSYTVTVTANGFQSWTQKDIPMNPGDNREVHGIQLAVGASSQTVQVAANPSNMMPTDSGELSAILSSKDIQRLSLESRNVSELLKILPGVTTVPNGVGNGVQFDFSANSSTGSAVGVGLSPNGAPYRGGTSYMLDGANIIDPGCNCWSLAVVNPDMTQEVKVQSSNFGADTPNGPVIVNAISKAGTAKFHGEAYIYARNETLNSNTWLNNHAGAARQPGAYYYPGGNIGGPVLIPGTNFNHNHKLLFWFGYEYYHQTLPTSTPLESYVPSAGMRAGNFTPGGDGNAALCPGGFSATATNWCNNLTGSIAPDGTPITGGVIPGKYLDPGAAALTKLFPAPNINPATTPGGYNYYLPIDTQQNGYVWRARVDYNLSDSTRAFVTYQTGSNGAVNLTHLYYNPSYAVLYPGGQINNPTTSRVLTANLVHTFSPTLTNEFIAAWGWVSSPYRPTDLAAASKSTIGYPYGTIYNGLSALAPSINSAGAQTFPDLSQPDVWGSSGSYPLKKATPSFADNLTKVYRSHTIKVGAYTELVSNYQGSFYFPNGDLSFASGLYPDEANPAVKIGSNNPVANLVMGIANGGANGSGFTQANSDPSTDMAFRTTSAYVMDNWQAGPRLTLNLGIRWDHIGRWYDRQGTGLAVWLPGRYASDLNIGKAYPGIYWHGIDPGIPVSGSPTRVAYTSPRLGFSWDVLGNGKNVIRGGWGEYVWNDQFNDYAGPLNTAQEIANYNSPTGEAITLKEISQLGATGAGAKQAKLPSSAYAADPNDYQIPTTYAWNLTVDRQLPWGSLFEAAYVGNSTHHLLMGGQSGGAGIGGSDFTNVNKVPFGGLFQTDPVTGAAAPSDPDNTSTYNIVDYYPYQAGYGTNSINVGEHVGYSNYNGLQVAWLKQAGRLTFDINYAWSKALGIVNSTVDAFSVHGNYGILNIDRPQVLNTSYAYSMGTFIHDNDGARKLLAGAANGWTVSGITTWQAGGNLQAEDVQNLGLSIYDTTRNEYLTSNSYFGTPSQSILPVATCNPRSGLSAHQLANLSCFSAPTLGHQGMRQIHPYLSGPSYEDSDLTVYKSFHIHEAQQVQFRASAFNFLNHSLWGFSSANDVTLKYDTANHGQTFATNNTVLGLASGYTWGTQDTRTAYSPAGYNRIVELSLKYLF
jgi:hypothetical protein